MENMVKHILDIDKQVQALHVDIVQLRLQADKELAVEIEEIKRENSEKFEKDCALITKNETEKCEKAIYEKKKQAKIISENMRKQYETNRKNWENEIFARVIGGSSEN